MLACVGRAEHLSFERAQPPLAQAGNAEAAAVGVRGRGLRPGEAFADRRLRARIRAGRRARARTTQREQGKWQAGQNEERKGRQELAKECEGHTDGSGPSVERVLECRKRSPLRPAKREH